MSAGSYSMWIEGDRAPFIINNNNNKIKLKCIYPQSFLFQTEVYVDKITYIYKSQIQIQASAPFFADIFKFVLSQMEMLLP